MTGRGSRSGQGGNTVQGKGGLIKKKTTREVRVQANRIGEGSGQGGNIVQGKGGLIKKKPRER